METIGATVRFGFAFDEPRLARAAALFGVRPDTARVDVGPSVFEVRFGRWHLLTPLANVRAVHATGPYQWWKVAGPPHVSLRDRGVTFATTTTGGVCVQFHRRVQAVEPLGWLRHPAATVTVADPDALVRMLNETRR